MANVLILFLLFLAACGAETSPLPTAALPDGSTAADGGTHLTDGATPVEAGLPGADAGTDGSIVLPPDSGIDGSTTPNDSGLPDAGPTDSGSDASNPGTDAEVDSGPDADVPDPECTSGTMCDGLTVLACMSGEWETQTTCPFVCDSGACTGVCEPGDRDCSGLIPRECNSKGLWIPQDECDFVCGGEGVCSGQCTPTATQCSGDTVQTCTASGSWMNAASACPFVCSAGACGGVCDPGDRDCSGDVPRQCNASGQWVNETACAFVCSGEGVCSGSCAPGATSCSGDVPRTCNGSGTWVNGSTCAFACSAGSCTGVCEPGDRDCSGMTPRSCNASGQWVNETACQYVCGGEGVCSGSCSPGSTSCSGDVPRTCNSNGQWTNGSACPFVCSAGACTGVCEPGNTQCSGSQIQTCNASGQWGTASSCGAVAGATSYCSAGACTFDCNLDYDDCDGQAANGCEVNLDTDSNHCGSCGHSCCGGTCGSGTCNPGAVIPSGVSSFAVTPDAETIYYSTSAEIREYSIPNDDDSLLAARETTQITLTDVATDGQRVAWGARNPTTNWGAVYSKTVDGSSQRTEAECYSCTVTPTNFMYDATNLYWQWASNSTLSYNPIANPNPNPTIPYSVYATEAGGGNAFGKVYQYTSDGTYLYARLYADANHPAHVIHRALPTNAVGNDDVAFETYTPLGPGTNYSLQAPITDGQYLYYVVYDYNGAPTYPNIGIWRKPLTGGSPTQVVASFTVTPRIATDGVNVYYVDTVSGQARLRKVSVTGGTATTLTNLSSTANVIRTANECVFWQTGISVSAIAVNP